MAWTPAWLTIFLGAGVVAMGCGDDGGTQQPSTDSATPGDGTTSTDVETDGPDPDDSGGCIPGSMGCACLQNGCVGSLVCVEDTCVVGPQIELDEDRAVLGGVVLPLSAEVDADEFSWSQVSGPAVEILAPESLTMAVVVPPDAPPGEVVTLRLSAIRNGVSADADLSVTILADDFQDYLAGITSPAELGTTAGLAFGGGGMWVVSTEGFVSRFDSDGAFVERFDTGGAPAGAGFSGETLLVANPDGTGSVQQLNSVSGNLGVLFDTYDGTPVGAVSVPLADNEGNVFVSAPADQRVLRYDAELGSAALMLEDPGLVNPRAMAFGPEGNAIYVGTVGRVWRVPLIDGGGAGEPEQYLDLGDDTGTTYEVGGLIFDEGNDLWVGCPNASTLFLARYSAMGPTEVVRSWVDPASGGSGFVDLRFGGGDFGRRWLYWTNLADGSVGRLQVGLEEIDAPLAD